VVAARRTCTWSWRAQGSSRAARASARSWSTRSVGPAVICSKPTGRHLCVRASVTEDMQQHYDSKIHAHGVPAMLPAVQTVCAMMCPQLEMRQALHAESHAESSRKCLQGTPGLSFGPPETKLGWNSQPTVAVMFDGVRVPESARLAAEGDGFRIAMQARARPCAALCFDDGDTEHG